MKAVGRRALWIAMTLGLAAALSIGRFNGDIRYPDWVSALVLLAGRIPGAKLIGSADGGHTWVGHDDEVLAAIAALLLPSARP